MSRERDKNKNKYGTFLVKKSLWPKTKKQQFAYSGLLLIFVIAGGLLINQNIQNAKHQKIVKAQVSGATTDNTIPGWWLRQYFGASTCEADNCQPNADPDHDGLTNAQEYYYHSDPTKFDTNGNGVSDGADVAAGYDPSQPNKTTFDQVTSQDNQLGEGLVFDQDFTKTLSDMASLNGVQVPKIDQTNLKVIQDNTRDSIVNYLAANNALMAKYFPQDANNYIQGIMSSQSPEGISEITLDATKTINDLKQLPVPSDALNILSDELGMLQLMPIVISLPTPDEVNNSNNQQANQWYDATRSFSYLLQQISLETIKLEKKYQSN